MPNPGKPTMKTKLTPRICDNLPAPVTGRTVVYDLAMPSLALVVTAKGSKSFYRIARVNGRAAWVRLGSYTAVSITAARKSCQAIAGKAALGIDVREERRRPAEPTLAEVFSDYYANYLIHH